MSIAEYQLSLKKLIDATNDETLLKRWKSQLEADLASTNENTQEPKAETNDSADYDIIQSGLGIDE